MTDVFLKIIEEFADGFLILDGQRRVIFFNDVLQRSTGLRSEDIFAREDAFLGELGVLDGQCASHVVDIADRDGTVRQFTVSGLSFESGSGEYLLVRVKPVERQAAAVGGAGWEQLFRNIGDPMYTADLSGRILCANPSFCRLVGYDPAEALPYLSELYLNPAELEDKILRLTEADSVFNLETHFVTRDRQLRRVLDSAWICRDDAGNVTGYTSHLKDVTYVKNLEARLKISERNYIVLFDTILSSIVIVDPLGRILNCNYSAEKLFGYRWQEIGHLQGRSNKMDVAYNGVSPTDNRGKAEWLVHAPEGCTLSLHLFGGLAERERRAAGAWVEAAAAGVPVRQWLQPQLGSTNLL